MTSEKINLEMIDKTLKSAISIAKATGLKGSSAIQIGNDLVFKELGVSPLDMCGVNLNEDMGNKCNEAMKALKDAGEDGVRPCYMAKLKSWSK